MEPTPAMRPDGERCDDGAQLQCAYGVWIG